MVDKTLNQLITMVQTELYQVAGTATQVYSKGLIAQRLQGAFDLVTTDRKWKRFNVREQRTLDGSTGQVTVDFAYIKTFDDIIRVYPATASKPLVSMPSEGNVLLLATGGTPRFLEYNPTPGKLITCWPLNASGDIVVSGRRTPDPLAIDQIVPFDSWTLIYYAAWTLATDDNNSPGAIDKYQKLFEVRKKQVYDNQTETPIGINTNDTQIPTRWTEA